MVLLIPFLSSFVVGAEPSTSTVIAPQREFVMSDGTLIPVRIWHPEIALKAIIIAYHGFNDSRDSWEDVAPLFTREGIMVIAPDQRGFGQTAMRGDWAGYRKMVRDVKETTSIVQRDYPQQPRYLMGESMGGAVVLLAMSDPHPPSVEGSILLAPAAWDIGFAPRAFLDMLTFFAPHYEVTARDIPVHPVASDNRVALRRLYNDPLSLHSTQLKSAKGLVKLMRHAYRSAGSIEGPVLCVYGNNDQLVPASAMKKFWRHMPPNKQFDYVPQAYHLLSRDTHRQQIVGDILAWMDHHDAPLPSGGDRQAQQWLQKH